MTRTRRLGVIAVIAVLAIAVTIVTVTYRNERANPDRPTGRCDFQRDFVMAGYSARTDGDEGPVGGRFDDLVSSGMTWVGPTYVPPSQSGDAQQEAAATGLCRVQSLFVTRTVQDPASAEYHGPVGSLVEVAGVNVRGDDEIADADEAQLEEWADQIADQVRSVLDDPAQNDSVGSWYLTTEELRYWKPGEVRLMQLAQQAVWAADPQRRPFFTYEPGHADADRIERLTPLQDVVSAGIYPHYNRLDRQRIHVRYVMDQLARVASQNDGKKILPVLEMYEAGDNPLLPDDRRLLRSTTLHDAMVSIANGATGFLIWSFGDRDGFSAYDEWFAAWSTTARTIRDTGLDRVVESGVVDQRVTATVKSGPAQVGFDPPADWGVPPTTVPTVSVRAWQTPGSHYLVLVNSAAEPVTAEVTGLPRGQRTNLLTDAPVASRDALRVTLPSLGVLLVRTTGGQAPLPS